MAIDKAQKRTILSQSIQLLKAQEDIRVLLAKHFDRHPESGQDQVKDTYTNVLDEVIRNLDEALCREDELREFLLRKVVDKIE